MPEHRRRFSPPQRVVEVSESDRLGCTEPTVVLWRRFAEEVLAGLSVFVPIHRGQDLPCSAMANVLSHLQLR